MREIRLIKIEKSGNRIVYHYSCSEELNRFFTGNDFILEYPESIEAVPDGVLAIPFAVIALPMGWLLDCDVYIPELDRDFHEAIPALKKGFEEMYPEATFAGALHVERIVDCTPPEGNGAAVFFSGGLDATTTLLRHLEEKPALLSIWGADVGFDNQAGWSVVDRKIAETAATYGLDYVPIRSMFRQFEDVEALTELLQSVLKTSWWYGIKHGMGIISHAAPYAWLHGIKTVYIASSNCISDGKQRCASDPTIDNHMAFCGCRTIHDGFELGRQDKTRYLIDYRKQHPGTPIRLRVCWKATDGNNCCACEKCYRTMAGFWVDGEDPKDYGFEYKPDALERMYDYIALRANDLPVLTWTRLKNRLNENWEQLASKLYREQLSWMRDFDFKNLENNPCRVRYQNSWKIKSKIVKRFPRLYHLYIKLRGYGFEE